MKMQHHHENSIWAKNVYLIDNTSSYRIVLPAWVQ